jgi:hypothetical protein
MRKRTLFSSLLILLGCAFLLITGCSSVLTEDAAGPARSRTLIGDPPPVFTDTFTLAVGALPRYYDLATGQVVVVKDPAEDPWDFGVEYQSGSSGLKTSGLVFFYTNSGDSGPGAGGVRYTGMYDDDFDDVQLSDAVNPSGTEYEPYAVDTIRYAQGMSSTVYAAPMNMMTYFGFYGGTGTVRDPFQIIPYTPPITQYKFYYFNKMMAYTDAGDMPPNFGPTGQVYIIAHENGTTYSKLQVTDFALDPSDLSYTISFQFTEVQ